MDITSLKTVLLVQTRGSIAAASRVLDLDPSSVSRIVATVEAELGIRLFQRTTRRLTVTEEGQAYLQRLAPLIDEMDAAKEEAQRHRLQPTGLLRMTASVAFCDQMIIPVLPDFQKRFPEITIDLQSCDRNLDLVENEIDLAVRLAPTPQGDLISTRLVQTHYRVVASPDYLKAKQAIKDPTDLAAHNCLRFALPGLQNSWCFQKGDAAPFEIDVSGNLLISNALGLRKAACMGQGIAILADWLIQRDLKEGKLIELFPDHHCSITDFETSAWALYPNRSYLPRKVRVMIDFLRESLGAKVLAATA
ncbi:LysR family transcriptional regulator [Cohaesibacter gelatinilyticus]|uniref:Transcriptional regulator, LysR family n=1 Tax=Cohaesibacter gelatinilyticus TaxID=372072 RepID=A0A285PIN1_9HYPH|nr:LysR family transcriptional regulator [Cohaesibacter gelatinilyticus]SNZ21288.1 transcriptional regulator, LysR family [Cohaesibacter gelatinilyticus]